MIQRVLPSSISLVIVFLALEFALRHFGPFIPASYSTGPIIEADSIVGWRNAAGTSQWLRRPEYTVHIEINEQGRPGQVVSPTPATGVRRIWLLGDSYAAGMNVEYERSLAAELPGELRDLGEVEVVNDAVGGYGLDQVILRLDSEVRQVRPEIAVVVLTIANDVWNVDRALESRAPTGPKPYFELAADDSLRLTPLEPSPGYKLALDRLISRSALLSVVRSGLVEPFMARGLRREQLEVLEEPTGEWPRAYRLTELLIHRLGEMSRAHGLVTLLVLNPDPCQLHVDACKGEARLSASRVPQERLAIAGREAGIPVLDLLPVFLDHVNRTGERLYYRQDLHWDERGHAIAARAIAGELRSLIE